MLTRLRTVFLLCGIQFLALVALAQEGPVLPDSLRYPSEVDTAYFRKLEDFGKESRFKDPELCLVAFQQMVRWGDSLGLDEVESRGQYGVAIAFTTLNMVDSALSWLDSLLISSLLVQDSTLYYKGKILQGVNYDFIGHFKRALSVFREALPFFRRENDLLQTAVLSNNIGAIHLQQGDFQAALEHFRVASEGASAIQNRRLWGPPTINLGLIFLKTGETDSAEVYFSKVYRRNYAEENWSSHAQLCGLLAELEITRKNWVDAEKYLQEGMEFAEKYHNSLAITRIRLQYGEYYTARGEFSKAHVAYDSSLALADRIQALDRKVDALEGLYKTAEAMQEYEDAFGYYKSYNYTRDSIFGQSKKLQLEELAALYASEQKQLEILRLQTEQELKDRLLNQQNWFIGGLAGVLAIALVLLVLVYRSERRRRAANQSLQDRNQKIAAQKQEIELANETLATQNQHLETLNAEMEGLVNIVAHDLKSPINKVQALTGMVEEQYFPSDAPPQMHMIQRVLHGAMELIQGILTLGKIGERGEEMALEEVELAAFMEEMVNSFSGEAAKKQIELHMQGPSEPVRMRSHATSLERILENLLSNALKFSQAGTRVTLSWTREADRVRIAVRDEGPGISEADQKIMFRKFQRLSARPTAGESSTGLGLAIVHGLVQQLGGDIQVDSELGQGTCFTISLPSS